MSDDRRKTYSKKGTGTVPKIKYAKNTIHSQEQDHNLLSNNLGRDSYAVNRTRHLRNSDRSPRTAYRTGMEHPLDESNQNSIYQVGNSNEDSRRNSTDATTKCDNITKYPDKRQIEDKLNQIRECLNITSSIVSNMKNSDDQSYDHIEREEIEKTYSDLKDSEAKLCRMLSDIDDFEKKSSEENNVVKTVENGVDNVPDAIMRLPKNQLEKKVEQANHQLELLLEQENLLLTLQQKAENQLREARRAQQKLLSQQNANMHYIDDGSSEVNSHENNATVSSSGSKKGNQDVRDLEDRWSGLRLEPSTSRQSNSNLSEQWQNQVDALQQKVGQLRDTNDNRTQLIQLLDKRDVQLQSEHAELQGKLWELQNKKRQVDQLVSQLQNMNDESEEDDMGCQVRKIVVMKEQLSKLKDMLEIVKNSENNINESDTECNETVNAVAPKSHNLIQNDVRGNQFLNEENIYNTRMDNNPTRSSNEQKVKDKQVNKKTMNAQEKERLKLQAELQAKKRELEELMCKHKAASSNLNQDVQCEYKPDMATINNTFEAANYRFYPASKIRTALSGPYSSDDGEGPDDDVNEYSEVNSSGDASNTHVVLPMAPIEVTTIDDYLKNQQSRQFLFCPERSETRTSSRTADNNSGIQPISNTTGLPKERIRSNSERDYQNKTQTQKQLELIRSVCDSMLEQQCLTKPRATSSQNVRNNLTPSPLYSEPRQFSSPNPHAMNALNVVNNPSTDPSWCIPNNVTNHPPNFALNDANAYQNWLVTNTLQTQAYMQNTLNQCCQMLWLQQREIATLRNNIVMMQEKLQIPFDHTNSLPPLYMNAAPCVYPNVTVPETRDGSQARASKPTQHHQVSSAASLPNLNHPHAPPPATNLEYAPHNNNLHNARILESGSLNNTIHQSGGAHSGNALLQGVAQPLPAQIWNGPALNNQVAPGNRANNYWDNFRSYSRQNLLSTKSNEGLQNQQSTSSDRLNNTIEGTFCYPFSTVQKRNAAFHPDATPSSSTENTPRRRLGYKSSCPLPNIESIGAAPPDVLNVNDPPHAAKANENADVAGVSHSNLHETTTNLLAAQRNRNEWHNEEGQSQPKSKLFEELRENVYKEVASLISANQGRPHFLLQLFRDLQLISSDPLRRQTLQSIQSLVSDSLVTSNSATDSLRQQSNSTQNIGIDSDILANQQQSYFVAPPFANHVASESSLDSDCPAYLSDVLTFLNLHSEEVLQQNLLEYLKELLVESTFSSVFTNSNNPKDSIIQKHFACLVAGAFEQFKGKKVQEVRLDILQTIEELLRGEISLIRLMRESISEANEMSCDQSATTQTYPFDLQPDVACLSSGATDNQPPIQNGDLAEADQSRMDIEEEEEGAVGGIISVLGEANNDQPQIAQEELESSKLDFTATVESEVEFSEQGLDQVPTRLSAHTRSKINTSRDRSNSSRSDTEQL